MEDSRKIDLVLWARKVWEDRSRLFRIVAVFAVLGLAVAVFSPRVYTAKSVFIPQIGDAGKSSSSLGGLASLAGINLSGLGSSNDVPPTLYPQFLSSTEVKMRLLEVPVTLPDGGGQVSYRKYFEKHHKPGILELFHKYTLGLPGELVKIFQKKPEAINQQEVDGKPVFLQLTFEEFEHFRRIDGQMSVQSKEDEGIVELVFSMPTPVMAAEMAQAAESFLQKEIIDYKIKNAMIQLDFVSGQFEEKKGEFEQIQGRLAEFRQRNQNIISAALLNQEQKLQAEYDFTFSIYTELAKQMEQAKIQVSKDTPAFSVIQKVTIPIQKSSPNRPMILALFLFVGLVAAISLSLVKEMLLHLKKDWRSAYENDL